MRTRRTGFAALLVALIAFVIATRGPEAPTTTPPGAFAFAVLGDAPYFAWEEPQFRLVRRALDASDIAFAIHVGDVFWRPCTDDHYREALGWLDELRHPIVYTPGDNETFDCWEPGSGGFAPQERWAAVRRIFFSHPTRSLGRVTIPLVSQGGEFVENARWTHQGLVFATVDVIGSRNGMKPFPARTAEDDAAARRRTEAAAQWAHETFADAVRSKAPAVVIAFQADPGFRDIEPHPALEPFLGTLQDEAARFGRPVLVVHGDSHRYTVDRPLRAANATRLEVPGSPRVGWVKVIVRPDATDPFSFENHVVPRWKYW